MTILPPALMCRGGALLAALALASCAKDAGVSEAEAPRKKDRILALSEAEGEHALENRYANYMDDIKLDDKGALRGGKRSQFEGQKNISFGGGVGGATYRTPNYTANEWSGRTEARTKPYAGSTDGSRFQTASRYQGNSAVQSGQQSHFQGQQASRSTYRTARANERSAAPVDKPTDGLTDFRRRVYPQPMIIDQGDLSVEETRSILGRSD